MDIGTLFGAWAAAFEKAYAEDEWKPLEAHLAEDACYVIDAGPPFGGEWAGREAFVAGLRQSVENLDRRFDARHVELEGAPEIGDDRFKMAWRARYEKAGAPDFEVRGHETVVFAEGLIVRMVDEFEAGAAERFAVYRAETLD